MDIHAIIKGAIAGFLAAASVDLHGFMSADSESKFDWSLALERYAIGTVLGAIAGAGLDTTQLKAAIGATRSLMLPLL